jgi:hypothetical protein
MGTPIAVSRGVWMLKGRAPRLGGLRYRTTPESSPGGWRCQLGLPSTVARDRPSNPDTLTKARPPSAPMSPNPSKAKPKKTPIPSQPSPAQPSPAQAKPNKTSPARASCHQPSPPPTCRLLNSSSSRRSTNATRLPHTLAGAPSSGASFFSSLASADSSITMLGCSCSSAMIWGGRVRGVRGLVWRRRGPLWRGGCRPGCERVRGAEEGEGAGGERGRGWADFARQKGKSARQACYLIQCCVCVRSAVWHAALKESHPGCLPFLCSTPG